MPISFNDIPDDLEVPGAFIEYDNTRAVQGLPPLPNKVILIGNRTAAGTAAEGELKQITQENDGRDYFGINSQLGWMCYRFKKAVRFTEVWAVALDDDVAGVANTVTVTFATNASSDGVWHFLVHGLAIDVAVTSGDTPTQQGDALVAALAAETTCMFAGVNATGTVTCTFAHAAEFGNDADFRLNYYDRQDLDAPGGTTVAIVNNAAGATNPDVTVATAAIGANFFSYYGSGYTDTTNVVALETELASRWGPTVQQDAVAIYGLVDTHANLITYGGNRNSQFTVDVGAAGSSSPAPPWEIAAVICAVSSGESDPARPRQTLPLPGILPPIREDRFTLEERDLLIKAGIATLRVDDGGRVLVERLVTSYKTNAQALPDKSFQDLTTMLTLAALRYTTRARITSKYPRHKLVSDGTDYGAGQAVVTPSVIRGEILTLFEEWEDNAWVEGYDQFASELIVERNASNANRVDVLMGPDVANQFRLFAAQIQFLL